MNIYVILVDEEDHEPAIGGASLTLEGAKTLGYVIIDNHLRLWREEAGGDPDDTSSDPEEWENPTFVDQANSGQTVAVCEIDTLTVSIVQVTSSFLMADL